MSALYAHLYDEQPDEDKPVPLEITPKGHAYLALHFDDDGQPLGPVGNVWLDRFLAEVNSTPRPVCFARWFYIARASLAARWHS